MSAFPIQLTESLLQKCAKLKIQSDDIEEKFIRGSGAGGQKINKTNSTVWLKHTPTGIEVKCQTFRERERNRYFAYKRLIEKMEEQKLGKESDRAKKVFKLIKQKKKRSKRSQEKMLKAKAKRGEIKESRKKIQNI